MTSATIKHAHCGSCSYCGLYLDSPPQGQAYSGFKLSATLLPTMPGPSRCPSRMLQGWVPLRVCLSLISTLRGASQREGGCGPRDPTGPCIFSKPRKFLDTISMATPV